ncbi:phenylacetate--CoA ligase family protein [Streptomyces sp. NPDC057638]|uniref:phenylacetate--CoA ligase family protein n=1 Tax=Streptomyces sp. NPDC057638 TaxID=3346190 RepID=UPI0036B5861B
MNVLREARREIVENPGIPGPDFYVRKLAGLWERAAAAPAYRDIGPFSAASFAALAPTPREELKARPLDFATVTAGRALRYYETTGSTGTPTPTPRTAEDVLWNTVSVAESWRSVLTAGLSDPTALGDTTGSPDTGDARDGGQERILSLMPSDVVPVGDLIAQVGDYLELSHLRAYPFATGITGWDRLVDLWRGYRPTTVFLAPGVALEWTRLVAQRGLLPELATGVRRLMLLGEVNTVPFRERLARWWGAAVHDASYGSTETGTLATTCPAGRQHLLTAGTYFELDTGGPEGIVPLVPLGSGPSLGRAASGRSASEDGPEEAPRDSSGPPRDGSRSPRDGSGTLSGQLLVTPLNAYARPLLRLRTGDLVTLDHGCACGRTTPLVTVHGRASDTLTVHGSPLTPREVENVVFATAETTGYLIEVTASGDFAGLLLERLPGADRTREPDAADEVRRASKEHLGVSWDRVAFVNALPRQTKSGASQKSWKRSNIRVLETAP